MFAHHEMSDWICVDKGFKRLQIQLPITIWAIGFGATSFPLALSCPLAILCSAAILISI